MDRVVPGQEQSFTRLESEYFTRQTARNPKFNYKNFIRSLKTGSKIAMVVRLDPASDKGQLFGVIVPVSVKEALQTVREKDGKRFKVLDKITVAIDQTEEETLNLLLSITREDLPPLLSRKTFEFDIREHLGRANIGGFPVALVPKNLVYNSDLLYRPLINNDSSAYRRVRSLFQIFQGRRERFSKPAPMFPPPQEIKLPTSPFTYHFTKEIKHKIQTHQNFLSEVRANKLDNKEIALVFYRQNLFFYSPGSLEYGKFDFSIKTKKKTTLQKTVQRKRMRGAKITLKQEELNKLSEFLGVKITNPLYLSIASKNSTNTSRLYYYANAGDKIAKALHSRAELLPASNRQGKSIEFPETTYGLKLYRHQILGEYRKNLNEAHEKYANIIKEYEEQKRAYLAALEPQSTRVQSVRTPTKMESSESTAKETIETKVTKPAGAGKLVLLNIPRKLNKRATDSEEYPRKPNYRNGGRDYRSTRQTQIQSRR